MNLNTLTPGISSHVQHDTQSKDATAFHDTPGATTQAQTEPKTFDSATISNRAERLAALNEEFNLGSPNFELSAGFVERLHELGFLSAGEAENLIGRMPSTTPDQPSSTALSSLQNSIADLAQSPPMNEGLASLLTDTADALGSLSTANAEELNRLEQHLTLAVDSETITDDKALGHITQARDVMMIAGRLTPSGSGTNGAIASYLKHSG